MKLTEALKEVIYFGERINASDESLLGRIREELAGATQLRVLAEVGADRVAALSEAWSQSVEIIVAPYYADPTGPIELLRSKFPSVKLEAFHEVGNEGRTAWTLTGDEKIGTAAVRITIRSTEPLPIKTLEGVTVVNRQEELTRKIWITVFPTFFDAKAAVSALYDQQRRIA